MKCDDCKRPTQKGHVLCDICAVFDDASFDLRYEASKRLPAPTDDLNASIELNYRKAAEISREQIMLKFPSGTMVR